MPKTEIGSEFHSVPYSNGTGIILPKKVSDYVLTFSGRTAIETVLWNEPHIKKALLPSYCCDSMIEPFRRLGIEVSFFHVNYNNGLDINISLSDDIDCLLWCNYFGYKQQMPDFSSFINRGGIIVEDITHSFYSGEQYHEQSQYLVASIRKWEPINCGGYCASSYEKFMRKPVFAPPNEFIVQKRKTMDAKASYLQGNNTIDKSQFLSDYSKSNAWLAENYSGLLIDNDSERFLQLVDQDTAKAQRIRNANQLYHSIKTSEDVGFLFDISQMDCPLFVPIVVRNGKRDYIRGKLISKDIYCPVHWPHPKEDCKSDLYETELSLICDQRYTENDMKFMASIFNEVSGK